LPYGGMASHHPARNVRDKPDEMGALMVDIAGLARFPFWFG